MKKKILQFVLVMSMMLAGLFCSKNVFAASVSFSKISLSQFESRNISDSIIGGVGSVNRSCAAAPGSFLVEGINVDDGVSNIEKKAMVWNTYILQNTILCTSATLGIKLPAGTFYFASGGSGAAGSYAIYLKSKVTIEGYGADQTILKPWAENNGVVDMFAFNEYENSNSAEYLTDVEFKDFRIDGDKADGKGFNINLVKNSDWKNVVVAGTGDTGFWIGAPVNVTIENSTATNCGSGAREDGSGSGFAIWNGYATSESATIKNSYAVQNAGYGFFFGNQSAKNATKYDIGNMMNRAFRVINSQAEGNYYNFGGLRANDVLIKDSNSIATERTVLDVSFNDQSRDIEIDNLNTKEVIFADVQDSSAYYYNAVKWAAELGVTVGRGARDYGVGDAIKRSDALVMMWRYMGRPGDVLSLRNGLLDSNSQEIVNVETCFSDVENDSYYARAVAWGYANGMVEGRAGCTGATSGGRFEPGEDLKRSEVVTLLMRLSGGSIVAGERRSFSDVSSDSWYYSAVMWAASKGILDDIVMGNTFEPDATVSRAQFVTLLWRTMGAETSTRSDTGGGAAPVASQYTVRFYTNSDETSYISSQTVAVGNSVGRPADPTRSGYVFRGWYTDDGKEYDFGSLVNANLNLYALWIPYVSYSNDSVGKWIFVNNPELVIGDYRANFGKSLYKDTLVRGVNEIYWEHGTYGTPYYDSLFDAYYGFRIYNGGNSTVSFKIQRCGAGATQGNGTGYSATETWEQYYGGTCEISSDVVALGQTMELPARTSVMIYQAGRKFYIGSNSGKLTEGFLGNTLSWGDYADYFEWDGVLEIVSDGELTLDAVTFTGEYSDLSSFAYDGNYVASSPSNEFRVYSGNYGKLAELKNEMVYEITDQTPSGTLPVAYVSNMNEIVVADDVVTNAIGGELNQDADTSPCTITLLGQSFVQDFVGLKLPGGLVLGSYPGDVDTRNTTGWRRASDGKSLCGGNVNGATWNWGNWAVHYDDGVEIVNKSSSEKTVKLVVTASDYYQQTVILKCGGSVSTASGGKTAINENRNSRECAVTVPAGETRAIPAVVTLGGQSAGKIEKKLVLE